MRLSTRRLIVYAVLALLPGSAHAQQQGMPQRVSSLEERVDALEQSQQSVQQIQQQLQQTQQQLAKLTGRLAQLEPYVVTVDCGAGQTVTAALAAAGLRASRAVITVVGTCMESVIVHRHNTVLRAGSPGAGIQSAGSNSALSVGARSVVVEGLAVTGGALLSPGSEVRFTNATITGSQLHGILLLGAEAVLFGTTVENNAVLGIQAMSGSSVFLEASTIRGNAFALGVGAGSVARLDGGTQVTGNGAGIDVGFGSMLLAGNATVADNSGSGITARGGSVLHFGFAGGVATISDNIGDGIMLHDVSVASSLFLGGGADIVNNGGYGVRCSGAPAVAQIVQQIGNVSGNAAGQIDCPTSF